MTVEQIKDKIEVIFGCRGDDEVAHGLEDQLFIDVLSAIGSGSHTAEECKLLAQTVLESRKIPFSRWCA